MQRALAKCRQVLPRAVPLVRDGPVPHLGPKAHEIPPPPLCREVFTLKNKLRRKVRHQMLLEGYAWPWDKPVETYTPERRGGQVKKRTLIPLERLKKIKAAIPRRTQLLEQFAKKRRHIHKVKFEWMTLHQLVKHRMKDD